MCVSVGHFQTCFVDNFMDMFWHNLLYAIIKQLIEVIMDILFILTDIQA